MEMHKNNDEAVGNYVVYEILIDGITYKIGKADMDRITKISGDPTRIHQQIRKLSLKYSEKNVIFRYLKVLLGVRTKKAKAIENYFLQKFFVSTGSVPEGNKNSFTPKK
jgi:hypothetical protein